MIDPTLLADLAAAPCGSRALDEKLKAWSMPEPNSGCTLWLRATDRRGRGKLWVGDKLMLAHRAAWTVRVGPIPEGMLLCHRCDNPGCINTDHIYIGTHRHNMDDMVRRKRSMARLHPELATRLGQECGCKNTWSAGSGNPKAKLTEQEVASIRLDQRPTRFVATQYGVERTTIQRIRSGRIWKNPAALRAGGGA